MIYKTILSIYTFISSSYTYFKLRGNECLCSAILKRSFISKVNEMTLPTYLCPIILLQVLQNKVGLCSVSAIHNPLKLDSLSSRTSCPGHLCMERGAIQEEFQEIGLSHPKTSEPQGTHNAHSPGRKMDWSLKIPSKDRFMEMYWNK